MRISDALVEKLLRSVGTITNEQLVSLREQEQTEKKPLQDLAIKNNLITESDLTKLYAKEIDMPFVEFDPRQINHDHLILLPERIARQYKAVVFGISPEGKKLLALEDPDDIQAVSFLRKSLGTDITLHIAPASSIAAALELYRGSISSELTKVISNETPAPEETEPVDEADVAEDSPIAQTVNLLIEYAVKADASDIHIEPRENFVLVRYRVDGILREANKLPRKVLGALVSRIKILSNLKIDERRAPQDGRFKIEVNSHVFAVRVSTLPVVDGEKVVMRLLNESSKAMSLESLGYWGTALTNIQSAITESYGMILITGPTGSGKSTSLFSILSMLNKPSVNISTVEDPVEYRIPGINQTQVNPLAGMTFANGLRALLRQDPNIIMVGEIRDSETANLAIQAALTGHLVFSTLHTNNAATSLPRLLDMGIEPFLIASTVRAVVGQRLVRKLCLECRVNYPVDEALKHELDEIFHTNDPSIMKSIHELELKARQGLTQNQDPGSTDQHIVQLWRPNEHGCDACGGTGYKGREGIYEVLINSPSLQEKIVANATSDVLEQIAIQEGMLTMQLDGLIKALCGITSIEELLRVTSER